MSGIDEQLSEREEIEMLLPWYMTGRLEEADMARVEAYLEQHPDMHHQLALIAEEQTGTIEGNEAIQPRLASVASLLARTETPAGVAKSWFAGLIDGLKSLVEAPTPGAVRWAAAAAAVIICLQAAALGTLLTQDSGGGYQTASRPGVEADHGAVALIAFTDKAAAADITRVLADNRLRMVDGPLPGGFYSVRFEDHATGDEQRKRFDAILARKDLIRAVMTGR
jgi:anti-sigma factor RsiW